MAKSSITLSQARAIYEAGLCGYTQSYSMMLDDIMNGMEKPAKRAHVNIYVDSRWFQTMVGYIRAHRSWLSVPSEVRIDMRDQLRHRQ